MPTNINHMTPKIIQIFTLCAGLSLIAAGCGKPTATQPASQPPSPQVQEQAKPTETTTTTQAKSADTQNPVTTTQAKPKTTTTKSSTTATKTATSPTTQLKIANQLAPQTVYVTIKSGAFMPQVVSVKAGGTVVWTNKDTIPHTTRSDGSLLWDSGTLQPGASYKHVFKATGSYNYSCAIHPEMKGTVYVY
jgi:plastocyanin